MKRSSRLAIALALVALAAGFLVYSLATRNDPVTVEAPAAAARDVVATQASSAQASPTANADTRTPQAPGPALAPATPARPNPPVESPARELRPKGPPPALPEELRAGPPTSMPKDLPSPEELREQFQMLRRFLELPPERLARIRESIERIEQMPEARKKTMLSLINQNQPERSRPVSPLAEVPEAIRPRFEEIWRQLTPEGRSALAERMRPMSREQRQAFLEGVVALSELSGPRLPWAAPDMWNVESEK